MKNYTIRLYEPAYFEAWNIFIRASKNATFLFHRRFMEYHSGRFTDFSLLVFEEEKLVAVLPANISGHEVFSHQGLTYGGLVYTEKFRLAEVMAAFKAILAFLAENEIGKLHLKMVPFIYHQKPAQELEYALFLAGAKLSRRDTLSVIDMSGQYDYSEIRKRGIKKAVSAHLSVREENDFHAFWNDILIPNLAAKHGAKPVHSLEEMSRLKQYFPQNIRQFSVYSGDKIVAGTTVFETETVAHAQYISASANRNVPGSLDFLYDHLLHTVFSGKSYFDFGISNENQGKNLNSGLAYWKESFGAGTVTHDFYEVKTANHHLLENILL